MPMTLWKATFFRDESEYVTPEREAWDGGDMSKFGDVERVNPAKPNDSVEWQDNGPGVEDGPDWGARKLAGKEQGRCGRGNRDRNESYVNHDETGARLVNGSRGVGGAGSGSSRSGCCSGCCSRYAARGGVGGGILRDR